MRRLASGRPPESIVAAAEAGSVKEITGEARSDQDSGGVHQDDVTAGDPAPPEKMPRRMAALAEASPPARDPMESERETEVFRQDGEEANLIARDLGYG